MNQIVVLYDDSSKCSPHACSHGFYTENVFKTYDHKITMNLHAVGSAILYGYEKLQNRRNRKNPSYLSYAKKGTYIVNRTVKN